jgi:hypothetical protein
MAEVNPVVFTSDSAEARWKELHGDKPYELVRAEVRLKSHQADRDVLDPVLDERRYAKLQKQVEMEEEFIESITTGEESLAETVVKAPVRATAAVAQAGVDASKTVAQATVDATTTVAKAGMDATSAVVTAPIKGAKAMTDAIGLTTKTETQPETEEDDNSPAEVGMAVDLDGDGIPDAFLKKNGWKRDKNGRIRNKGRFVKVEELDKAKTENLSPKPKTKR